MKQKLAKLTSRWIASDVDFNKFAFIFNVLFVATVILLRMIWRETVFIDYENFETSKVTFRETMGLLALLMAYTYQAGCTSYFVSLVFHTSSERIDKELATLYGILTLMFFLMNLFGFWGILYLPVSPPFLFLYYQLAKFRNVKESQD